MYLHVSKPLLLVSLLQVELILTNWHPLLLHLRVKLLLRVEEPRVLILIVILIHGLILKLQKLIEGHLLHYILVVIIVECILLLLELLLGPELLLRVKQLCLLVEPETLILVHRLVLGVPLLLRLLELLLLWKELPLKLLNRLLEMSLWFGLELLLVIL